MDFQNIYTKSCTFWLAITPKYKKKIITKNAQKFLKI